MNDKKHWYIVENTDVADMLATKGIFALWGGLPGTKSASHPESAKYLLCVDWAGRDLAERLAFERQEHVSPLPHKASRTPVNPATLAVLKDYTGGGQHAIADTDHTHDIIEKLSAHTGYSGWWLHL